jgi:hypothetical protein
MGSGTHGGRMAGGLLCLDVLKTSKRERERRRRKQIWLALCLGVEASSSTAKTRLRRAACSVASENISLGWSLKEIR